MAIAFVAILILLPREGRGVVRQKTRFTAPLRALGNRTLLVLALAALFYNVGFFTLLAFAPFPLAMSTAAVGWIFFGWGLLLAFTSVVVAPALERRIGTVTTIVAALALFAAALAVMAIWTDSKPVLIVGIVAAGAFLGINNTVITTAVMGAAPVERPVASAAYSFVRFSGGAVAPWAAGRLGEDVSVHAPFWMGAGAVLVGVLVMVGFRRRLVGAPAAAHGVEEAELVAVGDLD